MAENYMEFDWEKWMNGRQPTWNDVKAPAPEFQDVELAGPSQEIKDMGKAFTFGKGGQDYIAKESLTSARLNELLNKDNPYIKNAQNAALRQANASGMMSSTLAQSAATDAAIKNALPIAQQEAEILSRADLAAQQADIKSKLAEQGYLSNLGQMQQQAEYNAAAQLFESMDRRQQQEFAALMEDYMTMKKLGASGVQNAEDYARKAAMLEREIANRLEMQQNELASREKLAQQELSARERLAQQQMQHDKMMMQEKYKLEQSMMGVKYGFERQLAQMGYDNQTKQNLLNNAARLTDSYLAHYSSVLQNPNISDEYRYQYLNALNGTYAANLNSYLSMGGYSGGTPSYGGGAPAPSYGGGFGGGAPAPSYGGGFGGGAPAPSYGGGFGGAPAPSAPPAAYPPTSQKNSFGKQW